MSASEDDIPLRQRSRERLLNPPQINGANGNGYPGGGHRRFSNHSIGGSSGISSVSNHSFDCSRQSSDISNLHVRRHDHVVKGGDVDNHPDFLNIDDIDEEEEEENTLNNSALYKLPPEFHPRPRVCGFLEKLLDGFLLRWLKPVKHRLFWAGVHLGIVLFWVLMVVLMVVDTKVRGPWLVMMCFLNYLVLVPGLMVLIGYRVLFWRGESSSSSSSIFARGRWRGMGRLGRERESSKQCARTSGRTQNRNNLHINNNKTSRSPSRPSSPPVIRLTHRTLYTSIYVEAVFTGFLALYVFLSQIVSASSLSHGRASKRTGVGWFGLILLDSVLVLTTLLLLIYGVVARDCLERAAEAHRRENANGQKDFGKGGNHNQQGFQRGQNQNAFGRDDREGEKSGGMKQRMTNRDQSRLLLETGTATGAQTEMRERQDNLNHGDDIGGNAGGGTGGRCSSTRIQDLDRKIASIRGMDFGGGREDRAREEV